MMGELLIKCVDHDNEAVLEILNAFNPLLIKYGKMLIDDGYNELQYELLNVLYSYNFSKLNIKSDKEAAAYISTVVINKFNKLKKKETEKIYREMNDEYIDYFDNIQYDYDKITSINKAINELPIKLKEVIELRYINDLRMKEIEKKLGVSRQTIKNRLDKAKKILKEKVI